MSAGSPDTSGSALRILFITEDDPLYVIKFFEVFFAEYPREEFDIAGITVDAAFHEPLTKTARRMWGFYGPRDFLRQGVKFAATKAKRTSIATLATRAGIPVIPSPGSVNDAAYVARVRDLAPDVIVSVAAPEIFRADLLGVARLGCVNIHSGRLPKYRGMMPNFWQLLHGEPHATVTVHEMAEKLDAGAVLGTLEVPIRERDSLHRLIVETKRAGARLMIDVLRQLAAGTTNPQPVDMAGADYFSFPTPADVKKLRERGHRML
ncbi:MAG: formyl transferase [Phycisphaerales bacterium]|nr:formyl transferase [Phycisphaerae bacterium]NNF44369.1 formyl transferase [Phycisphaerales bacterium]NNM25494.1 formyl transferase [Phycisphaerales bacterium]